MMMRLAHSSAEIQMEVWAGFSQHALEELLMQSPLLGY